MSRLTKSQRAEIMSLHQKGKRDACEALSLKYGVRRDYASNEASKLGLPFKHCQYPLNRGRSDDPRWERAKAVGAVVA